MKGEGSDERGRVVDEGGGGLDPWCPRPLLPLSLHRERLLQERSSRELKGFYNSLRSKREISTLLPLRSRPLLFLLLQHHQHLLLSLSPPSSSP